MRGVAVLIVAAGLAAGVTSLAGSAAASHRAASFSAQIAALPSWSPDGKQIAFAYFPSSKRYRIVRTSSKAGEAVHTILAARGARGDCCRRLQWAADGRILVGLYPRGSYPRLESVSVQSGKPKRVVFSSCGLQRCPTWGFFLSPNRRYAAVTITNDCSDPHACAIGVGLVKLRRGQEPAVLPSPPFDGADRAALAFSPDGTQLVYSLNTWDGISPGPSPNTLMAIRLGTGNSVQLAQSGIPGASLVPSDARQLQWSPDGQWVAYVETDDHGGQSLEVVPTTGALPPRDLASCTGDGSGYDFEFSWSPTSKAIAYDCNTKTDPSAPSPRNEFMTVRPDGTHLTNLLKGRHLAYSQDIYGNGPQWSPDGSRLLFVASRIIYGGPSSNTHVWTVHPNGRDLTRRS
jgi:Tol biopolymer transport system component